MIRLVFWGLVLAAWLPGQTLWAHGTPIVVTTPDGKLTVDKLLYANLTEDDVIDNASLPFPSGNGYSLQYIIPGFDIHEFELSPTTAQNDLSLELLPQTLTGLPGPQYLTFWSPGTGLGLAPNNQTLRVVSAFGQVTAYQADTPVPPSLKMANVTGGVIGEHTHFLNYYLDNALDQNFEPIAADGLYALQVRLTSPSFQTSDPFWIMFDNNISADDVVTGSNAILAAGAGVGGPTVWQGASGGNWTAAASWSGSVPNSNSAEAKFVTTGGTTANLDANQTVNKLTFDSTAAHMISGANTLTLAGTTPTVSTAGTNTATQTLAVNLDLAAGTTVSVQGGTLALNSPANATLGTGVTAIVGVGATLSLGGAGNALSDGTTHVNVTNNGTLAATTSGKRVGNIDGAGSTNVTTAGASLTANYVRQASLSIGAGNTVTIAANGGDSSTSVVTNLSIHEAGKLDLTNNDLIVDNGNLATLTAQLASGLDINGTYGNGPGITSSAFASNIDFNTVLGIAPNSELGYTSFSGQAVDGNDLLIKYTYYGDADLNGVVDTSTDFDLYITGLTSGGSLGGWLYGDFDYNGTVDSSTDFDLYITGLTTQGGALLTAERISITAVPEPGVWVLGILGILSLVCCSQGRKTKNP